MKLYDHQRKVIDEDPTWAGLFFSTGTGKTRIALCLARGNTLVIAPKTQVDDRNWQREWEKLVKERAAEAGSWPRMKRLDVMTFDIFKRSHTMLKRYDTVIVDEAHGMLGVTPNTRMRKKVEIPRASQRFEALDEYLIRTKPDRFYLCTATIMKSPMTVWAAHKLLELEIEWDFYKFRRRFYIKLPMPGREVYVVSNNDKEKDDLASMVQSLGYVGRLQDFFDVPEQTFKTHQVELTEAQKRRIKELPMEYPEPIVRIGKRHQVENGVEAGDEFSNGKTYLNMKTDAILDYAIEFPRLVIFAKYRMQITQLTEVLSKAGYKVLTLTGDTKDRGAVIAEANALKRCVFIAQAQVSAGWELPEYPVMIFVSRTYSFVDYDQALGRIQRANNIKHNLYISLVVKGGVDEAVDKSLANKNDFNERIYAES